MSWSYPITGLKAAFENFKIWFWNPEIWLPPGVNSWDQVKPSESLKYPNFDDLLPWGIFLSLVFILVRYLIVEPFIIKPIGRYFGIDDSSNQTKKLLASQNASSFAYQPTESLQSTKENINQPLDKNGHHGREIVGGNGSPANSSCSSRKPDSRLHELQLKPLNSQPKSSNNQIKLLPQQSKTLDNQSKNDLGDRTANRPRMHIRKTSSDKMFKLCDCCWQLTYYVLYCIMGFTVLSDKPWLTDINECFRNFPYHDVTNDVWWYYMVALGYYGSSIITFTWQHQRKDAIQMLLHHVVTVVLIVLSWAVNLVRAGTLILIVHEVADLPLLLAKSVGYCGYKHHMDSLFVVFITLWVVTRLGLYPFWIMKSAFLDAPSIVGCMYPIYYIFNGLLLLLLVFHLIWSFLIAKILIRKLRTTDGVQDVRSDSEGSEDEVENEDLKKKE